MNAASRSKHSFRQRKNRVSFTTIIWFITNEHENFVQHRCLFFISLTHSQSGSLARTAAEGECIACGRGWKNLFQFEFQIMSSGLGRSHAAIYIGAGIERRRHDRAHVPATLSLSQQIKQSSMLLAKIAKRVQCAQSCWDCMFDSRIAVSRFELESRYRGRHILQSVFEGCGKADGTDTLWTGSHSGNADWGTVQLASWPGSIYSRSHTRSMGQTKKNRKPEKSLVCAMAANV